MNEQEQAVFEILKTELGESHPHIKDRTIEETVHNFMPIAPSEGSEAFWKERIAPYLKTSVAGNAVSYNSEKYKEWEQQKVTDLEKAKQEWEKTHPTPTPSPTPTPQPTPTPTPTPTPPKIELPEDVKNQLEELKKFKEEQERKQQEDAKRQMLEGKKAELMSLIEKPEAGMPNKLLRDIIFENFQLDPDESSASQILKIQSRYNDAVQKASKSGLNPFASESTGQSDVKSFAERRRERMQEEGKHNIVNKYYEKNKK